MDENECPRCGQDLRLPPINFRRMNWIIKLADKLTIADRKWLVARINADTEKEEIETLTKRIKGRRA